MSNHPQLPALSPKKSFLSSTDDKIGIKSKASDKRIQLSTLELFREQSKSCPNLAAFDREKTSRRSNQLDPIKSPSFISPQPPRSSTIGNKKCAKTLEDLARESLRPRFEDIPVLSKKEAQSNSSVPTSPRVTKADLAQIQPHVRPILRLHEDKPDPRKERLQAPISIKRVSFDDSMEVSELLRNGLHLVTRKRLSSPPVRVKPHRFSREVCSFQEDEISMSNQNEHPAEELVERPGIDEISVLPSLSFTAPPEDHKRCGMLPPLQAAPAIAPSSDEVTLPPMKPAWLIPRSEGPLERVRGPERRRASELLDTLTAKREPRDSLYTLGEPHDSHLI